MFRIQMEIYNVNYDAMLDTFMEQIKQQQQNGMLGGIKIPPMMNMGFLKSMPQETKDAMVASAINAEQKRMTDMLELFAAKSGQKVKIHQLHVVCVKEENCKIRINLDVTSMDYHTAIDKITALLIEEEDLKSVMGECYQEAITVSDAAAYMKQQDEKKQEFFVLKSMSGKKKVIMERLESMAADSGMHLELSNIRFMVQS